MNIREQTEYIEEITLSEYATLSRNSKGRKIKEKKCDIRTDFQKDRDKIIHSKSFRRLKQKTQVFLSPERDHYRTRLTHTLEVSQIARTIARALRLNEDLTEAIALGHDLGHTPFGHSGESALNEISENGFKHYEQSVRVLDVLERNGRGVNITYEVRNGILCHTKGEEASTPEGRVVKFADRIAYINHDIEDAVRGGILEYNDFSEDIFKILGKTKSDRIENLINSIIQNSENEIIKMDKKIQYAFNEIHDFMYKKVYLNSSAKKEENKIPLLIESLYYYFKNNINKLSKDLQEIAEIEGYDRAVCDYIAGMTDRFAVEVFEDVFVPNFWTI